MHTADVLIIGGGPSGTTCATLCAEAGLRVLLLERSLFPREKVCGDCLNPGCWEVFARLKVASRIRKLPHARIERLHFIDLHNKAISFRLGSTKKGKIAVKRSSLDNLLLERTREARVIAHEGTTVESIESTSEGWVVHTNRGEFSGKILVGADGRNSLVAKALGHTPRMLNDRIGLQTHFEGPLSLQQQITIRLMPQGYCGLAGVGGRTINLCLAGPAKSTKALKDWAISEYRLPANLIWRTITPLSRTPVPPVGQHSLLIGDAARVTEPFTGEGIFYALQSGQLAADAIIYGFQARNFPAAWQQYQRAHRKMYRGRLWVNQLAKLAAAHPVVTSQIFQIIRPYPQILGLLSSRVIGHKVEGV